MATTASLFAPMSSTPNQLTHVNRHLEQICIRTRESNPGVMQHWTHYTVCWLAVLPPCMSSSKQNTLPAPGNEWQQRRSSHTCVCVCVCDDDLWIIVQEHLSTPCPTSRVPLLPGHPPRGRSRREHGRASVVLPTPHTPNPHACAQGAASTICLPPSPCSTLRQETAAPSPLPRSAVD